MENNHGRYCFVTPARLDIEAYWIEQATALQAELLGGAS